MLILRRHDPRANDPGPTIGGLYYTTWIFKTSEEAKKEINRIIEWYQKYRLMVDRDFEPFELTDNDKHEMTISALKWKKI